MKKAIVHSSNGELTINYDTGKVINCQSDDDHLNLISRFDLNEYIRTHNQLDSNYDILDLGYWYGFYDLKQGSTK